MSDSYLFDIPAKAGVDMEFPGSGQAAMLQTMPATLISGGGRSLVRYNPSDKLLYRIASNGKWYRADGGNKRAVSDPSRLRPVPAKLGAQATKLVSAIQTLEGSMRKTMTKRK
jgi:hypothetical protein